MTVKRQNAKSSPTLRQVPEPAKRVLVAMAILFGLIGTEFFRMLASLFGDLAITIVVMGLIVATLLPAATVLLFPVLRRSDRGRGK